MANKKKNSQLIHPWDTGQKFFIKPKMPYLKLHFPFYLMGYTDEMISSKESLHILEALERVEGLDGR